MKIKYIGGRKGFSDAVYRTGKWSRGLTKDVPDDIGAKMLKHTDVYLLSTSTAHNIEVVKPHDHNTDPDNSKLQETYDMVNNLNKEAIITFVKNQFGQVVDTKIYSDIQKLRAFAIQLTDQYGVLT